MYCDRPPNEVPGLIPLSAVIVTGIVAWLWFLGKEIGPWPGCGVFIASITILVSAVLLATRDRKPR